MTMKLSTAVVSVIALMLFPGDDAKAFSPETDQNPKLLNGDSLGVRNLALTRRPGPDVTDDAGAQGFDLSFDFCAGDIEIVDPAAGLVEIKACPANLPPVSCSPVATSPTPRSPFGACILYQCFVDIAFLDLRDGTGEELRQSVDVAVTVTPTQPGLTIVKLVEYLALVGFGKNGQKTYLASRAADPSGTLFTVGLTVVHDDDPSGVPDLVPTIFTDGFESGDLAAWSRTSP